MPIFKSTKPSQQPPPSPQPLHSPIPQQFPSSMPEEPNRKGLLARLRNIQLTRQDPKPQILPDEHPQPEDPQLAAKAARREARREQRRKREDEWNEEYRQRRNFAIEVGTEMRPLTPLSDFDSASEDERQSPSEKILPLSQSTPAQPPSSQTDTLTDYDPIHPEHINHATSPSPSHQHNHLQTEQSQAPSDYPTTPILPQGTEEPHSSRDPKEDAKLAEMFAAQAFTSPSIPSAPQTYFPTSYPTSNSNQHQPSPIGWGGVYHSVPSQPMYGTPAHLTPVPRSVRDIDPILAENIRRGRELAMLAIEQEERGNLGAAEAGYIKALALLVPASKQLDAGSELNKNARMQQKAKIQREAAAMLDRCEELRLFLRANGPPVPSEIPVMPNATAPRQLSSPKKRSSLGAPPSRKLPPTPKPSTQSPAPPTSRPRRISNRNTSMPPSPPVQPPADHGRSQLLTRLTSRKDVLASASTVIPPDTARKLLPSNRVPLGQRKQPTPRSDEKCFMCSAPAQLRAKCGHTYCSSCGNQAVSVFGECPVPDCGAQIAVEDFSHVL